MLGFIVSTRKEFIDEFQKLVSGKTSIQIINVQLPDNENYSNRVSIFTTIYETIEQATKSHVAADLRNSFFMVDEVLNWENMNPTQPLCDTESVYAMLALTFPETNMFALNGSYQRESESFFHWFKNFSSESIDTQAVLFDPFKFRNSIKEKINKQFEVRYNIIYERPIIAHAIDEEESYAYFHGYIAYKMGYRCKLFMSKKHLDDFQRGSDNSTVGIQFEDLYLNFPDQKEKDHLSKLEDRDKKYSFLSKAKKRYLVTSGHDNSENKKSNESYVKFNNIERIDKPSLGIFDMIKQCKMLEHYWAVARTKVEIKDYFSWKDRGQSANSGGHGTPGIILVIVENLLSRAQTILKDMQFPIDALHAAVLAMEAKELLGNKTPTLTLLAVSLQQKAEITAECLFWGVEYNKSERSRLKEIELEIKDVSRWFNEKTRTRNRQIINARLTIVQLLAKTCNDFGRFDEELAYLRAALTLQLDLWRRNHLARMGWLFWLPHKYIEYSLKSTGNFFILVLLCIITFTGVYWVYSHFSHHIGDSFLASARFFFTLTLSSKAESPQQSWSDLFDEYWTGSLILILQGAISFSNLSLLLSQLYLKISRR